MQNLVFNVFDRQTVYMRNMKRFIIMKLKTALLSTAIILIFGLLNLVHANTVLHFDSDPDSWVGQGESYTVTPEDGFEFDVYSPYDDNGVRFRIANNEIENSLWWYLDLAPAYGEPLTVGLYNNASLRSYNISYSPGLDFSGNGRGNGEIDGYFEVLEAEYDSEGHVESFAVDFVQYGERNPDWGVYGSLRYNSNVPIVPEPISSTLFIVGGATLGFRRFRKKFKK